MIEGRGKTASAVVLRSLGTTAPASTGAGVGATAGSRRWRSGRCSSRHCCLCLADSADMSKRDSSFALTGAGAEAVAGLTALEELAVFEGNYFEEEGAPSAWCTGLAGLSRLQCATLADFDQVRSSKLSW